MLSNKENKEDALGLAKILDCGRLAGFDWKDATVPLLIPACSMESLADVMELAPDLFQGTTIAGLVPARLDADAYEWKTHGGTMKPAWRVEFKTFSNRYSLTKASAASKEKVHRKW